MSYLPAGASFEELVQDYFVAFRGSGLMLSPLDGALASQWAQAARWGMAPKWEMAARWGMRWM